MRQRHKKGTSSRAKSASVWNCLQMTPFGEASTRAGVVRKRSNRGRLYTIYTALQGIYHDVYTCGI
jgi:hypothetical protein